MKRLFVVTLFLITGIIAFCAQSQKDLARFYIVEANINGNDATGYVVQQKGYTVFYEVDDGKLYMANVFEKQDSQSWGPIYDLITKHIDETANTYASDEFYFKWAYRNSYDSKHGVCEILLSKIYEPQGLVSALRMQISPNDVTEYIGYMDGSIDFYKYK